MNIPEKNEIAHAPSGDVTSKHSIAPSVLVIHPSGQVDFVEADVSVMSSQEMARLIDTFGVDAVHYSGPLANITKACQLERQVTMYVDKYSAFKSLDDNAVATTLYGQSDEVRGAVIIALEDDKYDTYSFDTKEDIERVFEAISKMTGGLARSSRHE